MLMVSQASVFLESAIGRLVIMVSDVIKLFLVVLISDVILRKLATEGECCKYVIMFDLVAVHHVIDLSNLSYLLQCDL